MALLYTYQLKLLYILYTLSCLAMELCESRRAFDWLRLRGTRPGWVSLLIISSSWQLKVGLFYGWLAGYLLGLIYNRVISCAPI
jgi:hypothetical protein